MDDLLAALLASWGVEQSVAAINQIVSPQEYLGNKYFTNREGKYADNITIPIYRGDSIIMEAIPKGAPRPKTSGSSTHKLPVELARFADSLTITPKDIKDLKNFDDPNKQQEEFARLVGFKMGLMKNKFVATKEYMRMGAILGTVKDGAGKTLFDFKSDKAALGFDVTTDPEGLFESFEDSLVDEFGYSPGMMGFVSREFYNSIWAYALSKSLVKDGIVRKEVVDGVTQINYNGRELRPITASRPDKHGNALRFLDANKAIFFPKGGEAFGEFYTHAEHMEALGGAPDEYFSKVHDLGEGEGAKVIAESICIPVCTRPYAVRQAIWTP